nr:hypothetical protein [Herbaspirillum sp. ASV7]
MGHYINAEFGYYEGDQIDALDVEVPQRPNATDTWDGAAWLPAPVPVPVSVTPLQARRALLAADKLAAVETAVATADQATQLAWQYAASFERASPFVASLATAVGLTDAQIDDLFRSAATFV